MATCVTLVEAKASLLSGSLLDRRPTYQNPLCTYWLVFKVNKWPTLSTVLQKNTCSVFSRLDYCLFVSAPPCLKQSTLCSATSGACLQSSYRSSIHFQFVLIPALRVAGGLSQLSVYWIKQNKTLLSLRKEPEDEVHCWPFSFYLQIQSCIVTALLTVRCTWEI